MVAECNLESGKFIDWTIDVESLNCDVERGTDSIYNSLFEEFEYAGRFAMHHAKEKVCNVNKQCEMKSFRKCSTQEFNKGGASSVKTSDGYCNFHTHPFSCYKGEKTIWGWPSGEDMREVIGFMLRGNLFHLVFTLEGIYMIQVNPNFYNVLTKGIENFCKGKTVKANRVRGYIISLIESYFKATHGHRRIDYNVGLNSKMNAKPTDFSDIKDRTSDYWGICMPEDWVNFANKFRLCNLKQTKNKCTNALKCSCFPDSEGVTGNLTLSQYLNEFGVDIYNMDTKGKISEPHKVNEDKEFKIIEKMVDELAELFDNASKDISYGDDEKWEKGQWFKVKIFHNKFTCKGQELNFIQWMSQCIVRNNKTNRIVPQMIHEYWQRCVAEHNEKMKNPSHVEQYKFTFDIENPPRTRFLSFSGGNCNLINGDKITKWIEKQKKNLNRYGKRKRISNFSTNQHKR